MPEIMIIFMGFHPLLLDNSYQQRDLVEEQRETEPPQRVQLLSSMQNTESDASTLPGS